MQSPDFTIVRKACGGVPQSAKLELKLSLPLSDCESELNCRSGHGKSIFRLKSKSQHSPFEMLKTARSLPMSTTRVCMTPPCGLSLYVITGHNGSGGGNGIGNAGQSAISSGAAGICGSSNQLSSGIGNTHGMLQRIMSNTGDCGP